jgi:hypothetical protein
MPPAESPEESLSIRHFTIVFRGCLRDNPKIYKVKCGISPKGRNVREFCVRIVQARKRSKIPMFVLVLTCSLASAQTAVTTYHNDTYRTGANTQETTLTPSNVNFVNFGKLAAFPVQGYVYAQPLYVPNVTIQGTPHDVLYVADEHDAVTAFDVQSHQMLWQTSFLNNSGRYIITTLSSYNDLNCTDLVPEVGITGTPVIDTSRSTLYVVARTRVLDTTTGQVKYYHTLHALDLRTGVDNLTPQVITATVPGTGQGSQNGYLSFVPLLEAQRPALLLVNGQIVITFASLCDTGYYHGYVLAYDETTLHQTAAYVTTPDGAQGGMWGSGAGPAADSSGNIYVVTGNGDFTANVGGQDFGDSVIRLSWSGNSFAVEDYFTPWDYQPLWDFDVDLGSGGLLLLPDQPGTRYPHLLVITGKEGTIDLVNRDNMGHWHEGDDSQIVQTIPYILNGVWGAPAFWQNNVYYGGYSDYLKTFRFDPTADQLSDGPVSESDQYFNYPGPTPSVSSNGRQNGIVWITESDAFLNSGPAILRAYDANNLSNELYDSTQNPHRDGAGPAVKFTPPTIADGLVFVAAQMEVDMYGLLQSDSARRAPRPRTTPDAVNRFKQTERESTSR